MFVQDHLAPHNQTSIQHVPKPNEIPVTVAPLGIRQHGQSAVCVVTQTACKRKIGAEKFSFFHSLFHTSASSFIMGNLNSRETARLLESKEFKHVCTNLGDFFGSHGQYMQDRRRRASRKGGEGSHPEREDTDRLETERQETKTKDRRRDNSRSKGLKQPDLLKNLNWECPGGGECPWYKLVSDMLRRNPQPKTRESGRRNTSQDHHPQSNNEARPSPTFPSQHQRGNTSSDTKARRVPPTPQNGTLHPVFSKSHALYKTY